MLLEFKVRNFGCLRDEAILSMIPSSGSLHSECIIRSAYGKTLCRALPVLALYGANASGKSTLILAMETAVRFIRFAARTQDHRATIPVVPFALDSMSATIPTSFEFAFVHNGVKYVYGFAATRDSILHEYLKCWKTSRVSLIFERYGQDFTFPADRDRVRKKTISQAVAKNNLFFAMACIMNYEPIIEAMAWFSDSIDILRDDSLSTNSAIMEPLLSSDRPQELLSDMRKMAIHADLGIDDIVFEFEKTELNIEDTSSDYFTPDKLVELSEAIVALRTLQRSGSRDKLTHLGKLEARVLHRGLDSTGNATNYSLNINQESTGTLRFMALSPSLQRALQNGSIYIADEMDKQLHPILLKYLVELFQNPGANPHGAQLIFTTHTTDLIDFDVLRRDQIALISKDRKSGASELYKISDFDLPRRESIYRAYLLGKLGSVPRIEAVDD